MDNDQWITEFVQENGLLAKNLIDLWSCVLKKDIIDPFAELSRLGGDSLMILSIIDQIRSRFGWNISLGDFMTHSTIDKLLKYRDDIYLLNPNKSLVKMTQKGIKEPIVFIHPISGLTFSNAKLVSYLGRDRLCISIQSPYLIDGNYPESIEAMACKYAELIYDELGEMPFHLFGWNFGGIIGYEIAKIVDDFDLCLEKLIILDGFQSDYYISKTDEEFNNAFFTDFGVQLSEYMGVPFENNVGQLTSSVIKDLIMGKQMENMIPLKILVNMQCEFRHFVKLLEEYKLIEQNIPFLYFGGDVQNAVFSKMQSSCIEKIEAGLSAHQLFNDKNVQFLYKTISSYIN